MSNQSQRIRKNVSPCAGTKQGPIRATVPLSLMHQNSSPTKCLISSSSKSSPINWTGDANRVITRLSPDIRISPEMHFIAEGCRDDKSKNPASKAFRRTASVDTIYLLGQWQRDTLYLSYCGRLMMDRATQTPDEFAEETDKKLFQKRASSEMKLIRQRLQRTSHSSRLVSSPNGNYQRQSPVSGDHCAISFTPARGNPSSPTLPSTTPQQTMGGSNVTYSSCALPIPIPDIPKPLVPRMRSSVEGLNQEIEQIVLQDVDYLENDSLQNQGPTPEGHRAPIADLFRHTQSVDTQTPFDGHSTSSSSGSLSISPTASIIVGCMDSSRPSSYESKGNNSSPDVESTHRFGASPHINRFMAREPPDGCEKVKIAEESRE